MLAAMKQDLHDRLWKAQQRWFALRAEGATKRALKLGGISESGDPNLHTRNLIFAGSTRRSYEETLKSFLEFSHERFGVARLEDLGKREFRAFIEDGIARGLAASTVEARCTHLAKLGSVIGKSESYTALARRYSARVRELAMQGELQVIHRLTPSPELAMRAVEILRSWDTLHEAKSGHPRAYHLVARLQLETGGRSISVTERLTADRLKGESQIELVGKSGRLVLAEVPSDLYEAIALHLKAVGGALADRDGFRMAWRRAVRAASGRAAGTHGLRRLAAREFYRKAYRKHLAAGISTTDARREARAEAVERLGHSRDRADQAACYLGPAA